MKLAKKLLSLIVSAGMLLMLMPAMSSTAAETAAKSYLGRVALPGNSYIELVQATPIETNEQQVVVFDTRFVNNGTTDIPMIDYSVRIKNKNGSTYSVQWAKASQALEKIIPGESQQVVIYTRIPKSEKISNLSMEWQVWDINQPNYQRSLGSIAVPAQYNYITAEHAQKKLLVDGYEVLTGAAITSLQEGQNSNNITLSFTAENTGSRGVTLPQYTYYIKTKDNLIYKLSGSEGTTVIQPKEKKEIQLSASIPANVDTTGWQLIVTVPESDTVELPVAYYQLGEAVVDNTVVPISETKEVTIDNQIIAMGVNKALASNSNVTIYLQYENKGTAEVAIPTYAYSLRTDSGVVYRMNTGSTETYKLPAKDRVEVSLSASVPAGTDVNALTLQVNELKEGQLGTLIASFDITTTTDMMERYSYKNNDGDYYVELRGIQRLPHGDQDIVAAEIQIRNPGQKALPLLDLSAYFVINGLKISGDQVKVVKQDNIINLPAGGGSSYIAYIKVPYTHQFDTFSFVIEEKKDNQFVQTVAVFEGSSAYFLIPRVATGRPYTIGNVGKRAQLNVIDTKVYESEHTDLYYSEIEVLNMEKRLTDLIKLVAYYKTQDDTYYPATITELSEKVLPNGKVLLGVWSKLPKGHDMTELDIILGEQVAGEEEAFIKAVTMELPETQKAAARSARRLELYPYSLTLNNLVGRVFEQERKIQFKYNLTRDYKYAQLPEEHKLVFEVVDEGNNIKFEKEFTPSTDFTLGNNEMEIVIPFITRKNDFGHFTLNVYDRFEGHNKVIASTVIVWNQPYYTN